MGPEGGEQLEDSLWFIRHEEWLSRFVLPLSDCSVVETKRVIQGVIRKIALEKNWARSLKAGIPTGGSPIGVNWRRSRTKVPVRPDELGSCWTGEGRHQRIAV